VINPTAEELSTGPLLREAHSSVLSGTQEAAQEAGRCYWGHWWSLLLGSGNKPQELQEFMDFYLQAEGQLLQLQHHQH
jgi:hypothetical protein